MRMMAMVMVMIMMMMTIYKLVLKNRPPLLLIDIINRAQ